MISKHHASLLSSVSLLALATASPAVAQESSLEIYGLYLYRGGSENVLLEPGAVSPVLTTDKALDVDSGGGVGARYTTTIDSTTGIEVSGFYVRHDASFATNDSGSGSWSFTTGAFVPDGSWTGSTAALGDYAASYYGGEVSFTNEFTPNVTWSIGPRIAILDEDISLFSVDEGVVSPLFAGEPDGRLKIDVENHLVGIQAGIAAHGSVATGVNLKGALKGGLFANFVSKDLAYRNTEGGAFSFSNSRTDTSLAGIVEADLEISIPLTDGVELFAGGTGAVLIGVATGPANIPTANTAAEFTKLDSDDTIYYVGAKGGLRVRF